MSKTNQNIQSLVDNMTPLEWEVYNDISIWAIKTYGEQIDIDTNFCHFRDLYWDHYLKSQKNIKINI